MAASQYYEQIQQAYLAYYGRPADPAGQAYWATQLANANGNLSVIINAFGTSAESTALYAGSNTAAQVNAIYQQLFGRQADVAGLNYYVNGINSGQFTLASVALNVFNGAQGADLTEVQAKEAYADAFTVAVGQTVSAQVAYSGTAAANNARSAVAGVTSTATETTAVNNLPTTIANIGTGTVGQTVTLTTGVESVQLTGNNNVVNATANGVLNATFVAGDTITAAAGSTGNTLNVSDLGTGGVWTVTGPASPSVSGVQTVNLNSNEGVTANTATGYAGLTQLNVNASGAATVIAAATTNVAVTAGGTINVNGGLAVNATGTASTIAIGGTTAPAGAVTVNDSTTGTNTVTVTGGTSVNVNVTGAAAVGTSVPQITIGTTAAPETGAVTVSANTATVAGSTIGQITVNGGTTVSVTEATSNVAATGLSNSEGNVTVNGSGVTTSVTVNQAAQAAGLAAAAAVTGVAAVTAVTASAGVTGVAAVAPVAGSAAVAGVVGVNDGVVNIADANAANSLTATVSNKAGTISSVALNNFGAGANISSAALNNLSLSGTGGAVSTLEGGSTATTNTTLALSVNKVTGAGASLTDASAQFTTINVTTGASNSALTINDTALKTLNISGSSVLTSNLVTDTALTALNVSGAAGFNDANTGAGTGLSARGAALTITDTSSGKFAAALDATTQSFTGSTGQDVITINDTANATAFKAIAAGSATNNELILDGGAYGLTAAQDAKLTGFQTVGVTGTVTGTIDMSVLDATAGSLDIIGNSTIAFTKVAAGASISLDSTSTAVSVSYVDANGANDTTAVTFGSATNALALTAGSLTLQDANGVGVGTVNLVSNDITFNGVNTITTLVDNGLSHLNVSGTGGLVIGTLNEATTQATAFTLNNTDTGAAGVAIGAFTDNNLGTLTFTGTGASSITTVADTGAVLSVSNTGTGAVQIGTINDNALTSLTLGANVSLGQASTAGGEATLGLQDSSAAGVTVAGAADNAHVTIGLTVGAGLGHVDSITLGNGNDYVSDASTAGTVNVTVGTGFSIIELGDGAGVAGSTLTGGAYNVTLGAHTSTATAYDSIYVADVGSASTAATAPNTIITGAVKGDVINFTDAGATGAVAVVTTAPASVALGITAAHALTAAHGLASFQFGGNTYLVEDVAAATGANTSTVVELIGAHTFAAATSGHVALAS